MRPYNEIRFRRTDWHLLIGEALIGISLVFALGGVLLLLGCDNGEFERQQRIAEFNAKVSRACIPDRDGFVTVKWEDGDVVVRRYLRDQKLTMTKTVLERE